jgi:thiosulfate/3-mercaptopyruvate sulfurtransferase
MAEFARPEMLVDPEWLQQRLDDPNIRIVDCDPPDQYRRAHIDGAVTHHGDNYFKNPDDPRFIMEPDQFASTMSQMGIGDGASVVTYDASGSINAARLWWCLTYYGHTDVRVLNGGWNRWLKEGRPITMAVPNVAPAQFTPRPDESVRASAEYIMGVLDNPDVVILDVRSDGEWDGTNNRGNKRGGHMPGAVHCEWLNNITNDEARFLKPPADLRAMFEGLGVTPDKEIVTVCQGGIRAAQAMWTLKLLGYHRVRDYDGSFRDWGNRDDTPIVVD